MSDGIEGAACGHSQGTVSSASQDSANVNALGKATFSDLPSVDSAVRCGLRIHRRSARARAAGGCAPSWRQGLGVSTRDLMPIDQNELDTGFSPD